MDTIPATQPPPTPGPAGDGSVGVYGITVAAELAGMSVQALRFYERRGLLAPARTSMPARVRSTRNQSSPAVSSPAPRMARR